ncbi:hypothetical protein [Salinimonas chungwhensis]|uniref:hypothetical protein n=1 Tax=Salinimonas chungwhensis TaxID=265425 RepID=UPI00036A2BEA|nr:hypothetical protein [Salinimonas chungwhensis]
MITVFRWQWELVKQRLLQLNYLRLLCCITVFAVSYKAYLFSLDMRDYSSWLIWQVAPNITAVASASSVSAIWVRTGLHQLVWGVAAGIIIYEFLQLVIAERTFDVLDILATFITALLLHGVYKLCGAFSQRAMSPFKPPISR